MSYTLTDLISQVSTSPEAFIDFCARSLPVIQGIATATRLDLPYLTANEPISMVELARKCEANEVFLRRLVLALASIGVFEVENDHVRLSSDARSLNRNAANTNAPFPFIASYEWGWVPWGHLFNAVKTGTTAFDSAFGRGFFDYLVENPKASEQFNQGMSSVEVFAEEISNNYDFSVHESFLDVGGGIGGVALSVLKNYPHLRAIILDLPGVSEQAMLAIAKEGLTKRCNFTPGSFFDFVPSAECMLLRYILHDWDDRAVVHILKNCARSLLPNGSIIIADQQPNAESSNGTVMDLYMMVFTGGRERSLGELEKLSNEAGLCITQNIALTRGNYLTVLTHA